MKSSLLDKLREGLPLSFKEQLTLIIQLSVPAMLAQVSTIVMEYIDASMVGQLGANDSAAIGLVSTSTWLFGGILNATVTGFTVLTAQRIGAKDFKTARNLLKHGFLTMIGIVLVLMAIGLSISAKLPIWLGGNADIVTQAYYYFAIHMLFLLFSGINYLSSGLLQASGNMKIPSILQVLMCFLDVCFNMFLIFDETTIFGIHIIGAGLGVAGAALGTGMAQAVISLLMLYFLLFRSKMLGLVKGEKFKFSSHYFKESFKIAIPVGIEQVVTTGAMIVVTKIVAPLGNVAIAANSFAVTAENLCYMPGYGIAAAATTMIGQSIGAKRHDLTRSLGWMTTILGMVVMTMTGIFLYVCAPLLIGFLSPDPNIVSLGASVLRIEAFAEPLFAASIVATGVFRGAGDTLIPSTLNFLSMWAVRIPISAFLAPRVGLRGVWIAMATELCARGILFLLRLKGGRWLTKNIEQESI